MTFFSFVPRAWLSLLALSGAGFEQDINRISMARKSILKSMGRFCDIIYTLLIDVLDMFLLRLRQSSLAFISLALTLGGHSQRRIMVQDSLRLGRRKLVTATARAHRIWLDGWVCSWWEKYTRTILCLSLHPRGCGFSQFHRSQITKLVLEHQQ
jgi:hypothetical protein